MEVEHDTIRQTANRRPIGIGRIVVHGPYLHANRLGGTHADQQILEHGALPRLDSEARCSQQIHVRLVFADVAGIMALIMSPAFFC